MRAVWCVALAALGCSELKRGTWDPDAGDAAAVTDASVPPADAPSRCPAGRLFCDGRCVDVTNDPQHCGACSARCGREERCISGGCRARE